MAEVTVITEAVGTSSTQANARYKNCVTAWRCCWPSSPRWACSKPLVNVERHGLIGIPVGIFAHRVVVPLAADAAQVMLPASVLRVWEPWILTGLALAGVVIAVLGALLPARGAARLTIATVLHNE